MSLIENPFQCRVIVQLRIQELRCVGGYLFRLSHVQGGGKDGVSSTFDNSALAGQYVGLSINGGASAAWTITHVDAELIG
jgi:hypothetical protein